MATAWTEEEQKAWTEGNKREWETRQEFVEKNFNALCDAAMARRASGRPAINPESDIDHPEYITHER